MTAHSVPKSSRRWAWTNAPRKSLCNTPRWPATAASRQARACRSCLARACPRPVACPMRSKSGLTTRCASPLPPSSAVSVKTPRPRACPSGPCPCLSMRLFRENWQRPFASNLVRKPSSPSWTAVTKGRRPMPMRWSPACNLQRPWLRTPHSRWSCPRTSKTRRAARCATPTTFR
ncbi:hypothetical protein D3C72_1624020 [compost metagenome]